MKEFKYYLEKKAVKKQTPDANTARATATAGIERMKFAKILLKNHKPKFVLENSYESIREYLDAILYLKGYKSYSHEATISYILEIGLSLSEANQIDILRKQMHGIKYYGEQTTKKEASQAIKTAENIINKLRKKFPEIEVQ